MICTSKTAAVYIYTLYWASFHLSNNSCKKRYQSNPNLLLCQLHHTKISTPEMQLLCECKRVY